MLEAAYEAFRDHLCVMSPDVILWDSHYSKSVCCINAPVRAVKHLHHKYQKFAIEQIVANLVNSIWQRLLYLTVWRIRFWIHLKRIEVTHQTMNTDRPTIISLESVVIRRGPEGAQIRIHG